MKRSYFILLSLTTSNSFQEEASGLLLLTVEKIYLYIPEPCWALWQPHSLKLDYKPQELQHGNTC